MKTTNYSIRVYKEYFNFAASHFMMFKDGTREPLHGHNYRVRLKGNALDLDGDMVFDFLDIKPIVRATCDELDHKLLIPQKNPFLNFETIENNIVIKTPFNYFSIPKEDVLLLPIENSSVERLAIYLANQINERVKKQFNYEFCELEIEVEETIGQSAIYILKKEL
jgi:6-pyruvoyltetrahydropterin/6-carboxytetrahydropterin synthase